MNQSPTHLKRQVLLDTTIAFILGFALVIFALNFGATKVSADSDELTSNEGLSNNKGSLMIDIAPRFAVNHVGDPETMVTTVTTGSEPVCNVIVYFEVLVGPTAGKIGSATTDSNGEASINYSSSSNGIDLIQPVSPGTTLKALVNLASDGGKGHFPSVKSTCRRSGRPTQWTPGTPPSPQWPRGTVL